MRIAHLALLATVALAAEPVLAEKVDAIAEMQRAKEAVSAQLKDPESARFKDVVFRSLKNGFAVCGQVNAKNSFGGYVGFRAFYVSDGKVTLEPSERSDNADRRIWNVTYDWICRDTVTPAPQSKPISHEERARKNACSACHATDRRLVGPSYREIAKKYKGASQAQVQLERSIKSGSTGRWGDIPMPPNSLVADSDVSALAAWILAM